MTPSLAPATPLSPTPSSTSTTTSRSFFSSPFRPFKAWNASSLTSSNSSTSSTFSTPAFLSNPPPSPHPLNFKNSPSLRSLSPTPSIRPKTTTSTPSLSLPQKPAPVAKVPLSRAQESRIMALHQDAFALCCGRENPLLVAMGQTQLLNNDKKGKDGVRSGRGRGNGCGDGDEGLFGGGETESESEEVDEMVAFEVVERKLEVAIAVAIVGSGSVGGVREVVIGSGVCKGERGDVGVETARHKSKEKIIDSEEDEMAALEEELAGLGEGLVEEELDKEELEMMFETGEGVLVNAVGC